MKQTHLALAAGILCAAVRSIVPAYSSQDTQKPSQAAANLTGLHSFDFLRGEWRVRHRRVQADSHKWVEFDGTCSNRELMEGWANIEEHSLNAPGRAYHAIGLRSYDPTSGQWSIWWLDGRHPAGPLDPAVRGRFANGIGTFYSDYMDDGKPMRVRFTWSDITPTSARWEQALSSDAGKTWKTNWIMEFGRLTSSKPTSRPAEVAADQGGPRDFSFLVGEWRVHHRYFRAAIHEWTESTGTCSHRPLLNAWANIEEHVLNAPGGAYRALGLRSYDPATRQWAIWWLDGRDPAGPLDPPVRGGFENGVGTFYADSTLNGKAIRMRFIWSDITPTSARWEQAVSSNAGTTWETNWIMEFQRVP